MMAEKKKFRLFPLIFSLYTLLCLVAVGTGLWLLWGFLDVMVFRALWNC